MQHVLEKQYTSFLPTYIKFLGVFFVRLHMQTQVFRG